MAKPIKETPILYGSDAKRFNDSANDAKRKQVSSETKNRIRDNYNYLKTITVG